MEKEINLKNLFAVIRRRLWVIVVLTIIITSVGAAYSIFFKTPLYASSSRILIPANNDTVNTLKVMINEPVVMEKVAAELNINRSASTLSGQISTESVQSSQIVKITVVDTDPVLAAKIANTTAAVYKQEAASTLKFNDVSILSEATATKYSVPININHTKTIMIAFFVGLVLSVGFIFLLDSLDDTIKSARTIEKLLDIPTLGSISKMNKRNIVDKQSKREPVSLRGRDNWFIKVEEKETKSRKKA
ncbi:putative capsular polysaccharide biosynthesis protein YwqC [Bacillus rhizoplanae]|uniref:Capsular polysaccharide biosynthesis protein YwqC n=1 Tax=Bacillus rhizoplanae TaxID=2880966 RepID=A0ABM8YDG1_9BACI|nr:Wzz/FepE/Etk N-terminal domain-containing protein [Bacillus rhizoplanae]CAG9613774.1 putative capsular polysaccharide biosynthesis protein YwqC [Bacillus rhizoplanae]